MIYLNKDWQDCCVPVIGYYYSICSRAEGQDFQRFQGSLVEHEKSLLVILIRLKNSVCSVGQFLRLMLAIQIAIGLNRESSCDAFSQGILCQGPMKNLYSPLEFLLILIYEVGQMAELTMKSEPLFCPYSFPPVLPHTCRKPARNLNDNALK